MSPPPRENPLESGKSYSNRSLAKMARVRLEGIRKMYQDSVVAVHGVDLDVAD
jgi:hypothetical protein